MTTDALPYQGLVDVARAIKEKKTSPLEVMDAVLSRIDRVNPLLNAFLLVAPDAREQAQAATRALEVGKATGSLHGVPISIKDLVDVRGMPTTAGSRVFGAGRTGHPDAPVIKRLRRAGALMLGKVSLHELALGVTNHNEHFGPVRNPWDRNRIPGGSSGGSAAAVAAGLGYGSVGSDTRGSIRIPAACCGVVGFKPTIGAVPTDGVVPLAWSLDHVGPLTRSVEDAAAMLGAMVGGRATHRYFEAMERPLDSIRLGVCHFFLSELDAEFERTIGDAIQVVRGGRPLADVAIPELQGCLDASVLIGLVEAVTYHDAHLRENPEAIGAAVRSRLVKGYDHSAVELVRAERRRAAVTTGFERAFEQVDCLLGASIPAFPCPVESDVVRVGDRDVPVLAAFTRLTAPANMAGIPALSIPCGFGSGGLPISLQLMAARGREDVLFTVGAHFQRATDWHRRRPPIDS